MFQVQHRTERKVQSDLKKKKRQISDTLGCFGYVPKSFLYDFSSGTIIDIN